MGVQFSGSIRHAGPQDEKAVILGEFTGDVEWNGVLQVPHGGKLIVEKSLRCREMMVGGEIGGANDEVVIEAGLLRLGESASIDVATVNLPPGGLEQSLGSVINAKLRMTKENVYAEQAQAPAASSPAAAPAPHLCVVPSGGQPSGQEPGAAASLVQVQTRTPNAAYGS